MYTACSALLYIGEQSLKHYERLGVARDRLWFSPYCVDTTSFEPSERGREQMRASTRRELKLDDETFMLLYSGKLSARKGVDVLIQALKEQDQERRDKTAVAFLGSGELEPELRSEAGRDPIVDARFLGFKNQSELSRYYHAADALVLPSLRGETWGLVVNEALHHGLPCLVTSAVGCAPDLIQEARTGFVVAPGSQLELANKIADLQRLSENPQTRNRCREVVSGYTVEAAARGIADALASVTRES